MEEIIQLFRRLKKSKSHQNGLNLELASPPFDGIVTASEADGLDEAIVSHGKNDGRGLQKAKFRLKRPRLTSPTEKRINQRRQAQIFPGHFDIQQNFWFQNIFLQFW